MKRWLIGGTLVFICLSFAQIAQRFEIRLPHGVQSQEFYARYILSGDNLGGAIQPRAGLDAYSIGTLRNGLPATGIKAILYAPRCAVRPVSLPLSPITDTTYHFECRPVSSISLSGLVVPADLLVKHDVKVQARYMAYWAQKYLGLGGGSATVIPIGDVTYIEADSHFHLTIPDLSQDPTAGTPGPPAELQVWVVDRETGDPVAQLIPQRSFPLKTKNGGLRLQPDYPSEIVFAPCEVNVNHHFTACER